MLKKGDVILALIIISFVLAGYAFNSEKSLNCITSFNGENGNNKTKDIIAVIKKDGLTLRTINLSKIRERLVIKINGLYAATIIAEKGRICYLDSNCPDKMCINAGWLRKTGDFAVCLPNKTIIKIK